MDLNRYKEIIPWTKRNLGGSRKAGFSWKITQTSSVQQHLTQWHGFTSARGKGWRPWEERRARRPAIELSTLNNSSLSCFMRWVDFSSTTLVIFDNTFTFFHEHVLLEAFDPDYYGHNVSFNFMVSIYWKKSRHFSTILWCYYPGWYFKLKDHNKHSFSENFHAKKEKKKSSLD